PVPQEARCQAAEAGRSLQLVVLERHPRRVRLPLPGGEPRDRACARGHTRAARRWNLVVSGPKNLRRLAVLAVLAVLVGLLVAGWDDPSDGGADVASGIAVGIALWLAAGISS